MDLHPSIIISWLIRISFFIGVLLLIKWTAYDFRSWDSFSQGYKRLFPLRMAIVIWIFCFSIFIHYVQN